MYMKNSRFCTDSTCCIESTGAGLDPTSVEGTICAGDVHEDAHDTSCMLAKIYFKAQDYRAGFRPCEAREQGTMFPELVRLFK